MNKIFNRFLQMDDFSNSPVADHRRSLWQTQDHSPMLAEEQMLRNFSEHSKWGCGGGASSAMVSPSRVVMSSLPPHAQGSGVGVWNLRSGVSVSGLDSEIRDKDQGSGFRVQTPPPLFWFGDPGFGFWSLGFGHWVLGFRI